MVDSTQHATMLQTLHTQLNESHSLMAAYQRIEPLILRVFNAKRMSLFQRRLQHQDLVARFKTGEETREIKVSMSPQSIVGYVAIAQQALIINDPYNDELLENIHSRLRFDEKFDQSSQFKTNNILCIPVMNAGVLMGVMQIINTDNSAGFSDSDLSLALAITDMLGDKFRYELGGTSKPFDYLVHKNLVSRKIIEELSQDSTMKESVQRLISEHHVAEKEIGTAISVHYQVPFIPYFPDNYHLYQTDTKLNLPYLKRNYVAVLADMRDVRDMPIVLMSEPNNASLLMEIESALGIDSYEIAVGLPSQILQYLGENSSGAGPGEMDEILDEIGITGDDDDGNEDLAEDAPAVVRLVSRVLHDAKKLNASDIHIDPEKGAATRVRMRVDGVIRDFTQVPASHHSAVIARIKIMSSLNIAEKRVPQDGKLAFKMSGQAVEVRVATIPTIAGEGAVMRILAAGSAMPIGKMNLSKRNLDMLENMVKKPHGILLVVGPTGCGKTTTLHAILGYLNTPNKKIWTAEDPVEITQAGLQQVQVNPKIGFTFANALRAFLRADPDIILIGEMRDKETAHAGIEASLTGHLVLSTLHTNSAPETIARLLDLGLDPVNFSDACVGILAQRLIRTLCPDCKKEYPASQSDMSFLKRQYGDKFYAELGLADEIMLYKAAGCGSCGDSGYRGRTGVHELLAMTDDLRALVYQESAASEMKAQAILDGMRTLTQDAVLKILKGDTDISQIKILSGHD